MTGDICLISHCLSAGGCKAILLRVQAAALEWVGRRDQGRVARGGRCLAYDASDSTGKRRSTVCSVEFDDSSPCCGVGRGLRRFLEKIHEANIHDQAYDAHHGNQTERDEQQRLPPSALWRETVSARLQRHVRELVDVFHTFRCGDQ